MGLYSDIIMKQVRKFGEPLKTTQEGTSEVTQERNVGPDFGSMLMLLLMMQGLNPQDGGGGASPLALETMGAGMPGRESPFPALAPMGSPGSSGYGESLPLMGGMTGGSPPPEAMEGIMKILLALLGRGNARL